MINTRNENIYLAGCLTFPDVRKHFAYHQGKSAAVCFLIMLLASAICFEMNGPVTGGTWSVRALLNFLAAVTLFGSHGDRNGNLILPSLQNIQNESAAEICQKYYDSSARNQPKTKKRKHSF